MALVPANRLIGICGLGQMGASAAVCFSRAGFPVLLWGRDPQKVEAVRPELARMSAFLDEQHGPASQAAGPITLTADLSDVDRRADVILEAVTEDLGQKCDLLARLTTSKQREVLFLSTTSGLSITQMARNSGVGRLLVGAHFWNPSHLMPIVEIVRGAETPDDRMDAAVELMQAIGKIPVRVEKDVPGFIGNRLLHALFREAIHLVETGVASPEDVDRVASLTFALRMPAVGPFANMDLVGLELVRQIQSYLLADLSKADGPQPGITDRLAAGHAGMRTGRGFHDWSRRNPQAVVERRDKQIVNQLKFLKTLDEE